VGREAVLAVGGEARSPSTWSIDEKICPSPLIAKVSPVVSGLHFCLSEAHEYLRLHPEILFL
jgi:hypothetical protein